MQIKTIIENEKMKKKIMKHLKIKILPIALLSIATLSSIIVPKPKAANAWDVQLINAGGGVYDFGLLATASDNDVAFGERLDISIPGFTSVSRESPSSPGNGIFTPTVNNSVGSFALSWSWFAPPRVLAVGEGFSTFRVNAPAGAAVATVSFSGNTLDNSTINLLGASGGSGNVSGVPFEFSSTPGLIAMGAIFGLNFWRKRYLAQRGAEGKKQSAEGIKTLSDNLHA